MPPQFQGSIPALITPFRNGTFDEQAFAAFAEWQIDAGSHGLVVGGTTGESPCISGETLSRAVAIAAEVAAGRVPVIGGCGSNCSQKAIELAENCSKAGADALLAVAPYYNKPTQEGIYRHFWGLSEATDLPLIVYNVPGRTVTDVKPETVARLAKHPRVIGLKDASGDLARVSRLRELAGPDFLQLSGDDATALGFMAHGGHGCISVTANVVPDLCAAQMTACLKGDYAAALAVQDKIMPLHDALFLETSPAPAKYALSLLGKCDNELRLPLVPVMESTRCEVRAAMRHAGLNVMSC